MSVIYLNPNQYSALALIFNQFSNGRQAKIIDHDKDGVSGLDLRVVFSKKRQYTISSSGKEIYDKDGNIKAQLNPGGWGWN